ncbi:MAG: ATP-dependent Clp protease adaptor ClpS [Phycisphaerae bacterium]
MSQEYVAQHEELTDGGSDIGVVVAPAKAKPVSKLLPPFKVLLHNDNVNDMLFVVEKVVELTPLTIEDAVERMLEAHQTGVCLLLVTHKERAELYCEQFSTYSLIVTIEPDL